METRLDDLDLLVIQIDGIHMDEDMLLVAAIGVDANGDKHPLGLIEGATENATTVQALIDDLVERGLDPTARRLFIIDGSKALSKAIRRTFGRDAAIQRCQIDKARNILERLPKSMHASVRRVLRQAWEMEALACRKGGNHVDWRVALPLLAGPPGGLALDGDDPLGGSGQCGYPGDEAALELLGVQHGEDIAKMVVRRRAVGEGAEAAQKVQLLAAEQCDAGDGLRAGQDGDQAEEKDLFQRVVHLPLLAGILQIIEMTQKNYGFVERRAVACRLGHGSPL